MMTLLLDAVLCLVLCFGLLLQQLEHCTAAVYTGHFFVIGELDSRALLPRIGVTQALWLTV